MRVLVVGQNSVWQNTYQFESIAWGKVNRALRTYSSAAGKGSNVSRALAFLGIESWLLAYVGGPNGAKFQAACEADGIAGDYIGIARETRVCTTLIESSGRVTEIVEPAPDVDDGERAKYAAAFEARLPGSGLLVISGTAAGGEPANAYRDMIHAARGRGIPVVLDSYRSHGRAALEAHPQVLKINLDELAELSGRNVESADARFEAYAALKDEYRLNWIAITMGASGAEAFDGTHVYVTAVPEVTAVNPIGSGDSFTAGLVATLAREGAGRPGGIGEAFQDSLPSALRNAAAAGTANCMSIKPGSIAEDHFRYAFEGTAVRKVN